MEGRGFPFDWLKPAKIISEGSHVFVPTGALKRVRGYDKAFILGKTDAVAVLWCVKLAKKEACSKI